MTPPAPVTLIELNKTIKSHIRQGLDIYWLIAEISEISENYSGHCYLEFIQKEDNSEKIISRARATIWATAYRMIKPYFETTTGQRLSEGLKIMVRVKVEFHEIYGLSLNVIDIEPTYTVGEAALRKQKIIEKLRTEGVFDMNQGLEFPVLPQKLAIISSKTAAGLEDFINQLTNNPQHFKFYYKLFPAIMQGNEAESSIINQLDIIFRHIELFDAVVIIRGGGAQADLDCFNNYWLAYHICQFPLPVITGIGHEQDDSIVDLVAHTRQKTPTAVAEFLIDKLSELSENLEYIQSQIIERCKEIIANKKIELIQGAHKLQYNVQEKLNTENRTIDKLQNSYNSSLKTNLFQHKKNLLKKQNMLERKCQFRLQKEFNKMDKTSDFFSNRIKTVLINQKFNLEIIENKIALNNPIVVLQKGYTITTRNNKIIKNADELLKGDKIETVFYNGKRKSIIE